MYQVTIMDLPKLIMVDILLRLPIKSIFCFRCVCKFFYTLSSDPSFLNLYRPPFPCLLVSDVKHNHRYITSILELKGDYDYYSCTQNRPIMLNPKFHLTLVGSCNGFVCLLKSSIYDYNRSVYICNPLLGEYFKIKAVRKGPTVVHMAYGFCYSKVSRQYKVLRLVQRIYQARLGVVSTLEVYTLGVDKNWRTWGEASFPLCATFDNVYVNDAVHGLHVDDYDDDPEEPFTIFSFDFETEHLHYIPVPPGLANEPYLLKLGELRDYLCLINTASKQQVDIWLMKEYGNAESWTKDHIVMDCIPPDIDCTHFVPTITWKDGEILIQTCYGTELVSYCPKENKFRKVNVYGSEGSTIYVDKYIPSFNSLKSIMGDSFQVKNVYPKAKIVL